MPPSTKRVGRNDRRSRSRRGPGSRPGARAPRVGSHARGFAAPPRGGSWGVRRCRASDRTARGGALCGSWIGPAGHGCWVGSRGSSNGTSRRATPFDSPSPAVVAIAWGGPRPHRGWGSRVGRPRGPSLSGDAMEPAPGRRGGSPRRVILQGAPSTILVLPRRSLGRGSRTGLTHRVRRSCRSLWVVSPANRKPARPSPARPRGVGMGVIPSGESSEPPPGGCRCPRLPDGMVAKRSRRFGSSAQQSLEDAAIDRG
jgi:hypothetical protein